jgi:hypothetical protein
MNKNLKLGLILGGITLVGVGLFFVFKKNKKTTTTPPTPLPPLSSPNDAQNDNVSDSNMSATAQNGKIVIKKGSKSYTYELDGYALFSWWSIYVNKIDLANKKVTYTNPQNNQQSTESLVQRVITDIKNGLGNSTISMGETDDGNKIRLTKVS